MATVRWDSGVVNAVLLLLMAAAACADHPPTAPNRGADQGMGAGGGSGGGAGLKAPVVTTINPNTGTRNTTIDVQVGGSGFDAGSRAVWALNGDTTFATTRIKVSATRYASAKKLIATITIGADAPLDSYDVQVITKTGKQAIGSELFTVTVSTAMVQPTVETDPAHHQGDTADDAAIWIHPNNPSLSVVIGNDKDGGLMLWGLDGRELQYVDGTAYNNLDLRYNFPLAGHFSNGTGHQTVALVGVGDELGRQIDFFKIDPNTRRLEPAGSINTVSGLVPYGACMYRSAVSGNYYFIVNDDNGLLHQYELRDGGSGQVAGSLVRSFAVGSQTEGCVADDVLGHLYIGEEAIGIWKYGAEPGVGSTRTQVDKTGSGGHLVADVEGLSIYYAGTERGYLLASSQGNSTVVVYTREGANSQVGKFTVGANGTIDVVSGSDGLDVTSFPLGTGFSQGLFAIHDASNSGASATNVKYVSWESIASALGLVVNTTYDPRSR